MIRLPNAIMAFAKDDVNVYERFVDYFNHFHGKTGKFDDQISLSEKKEKINFQIREQIGKLANVPNVGGIAPEVLATAPQYQWATFAVIGAMVDAILPDAIIDSIGLYTDLRVGGYGDSFAFDIEARDLFVVSKYGHAGRSAEVKKQFKGQVTIVPEFREITVQTSLYKVLAGLEDMAEFAMKAARSIETQMSYDAYAAFDTAMTALPTTGTNTLKVAGYTQGDLVHLGQTVTAWNGGRKAVIVGTQLALQNILPADVNYRYSLDSEYVKMGYIKTAFGFDIMVLPQVADYKTEFSLALNDSKIYVVSPSGDKLIKGALEGATMSNVTNAYTNANLTDNVTMRKSWGFAVATSSIAALITL